MQKNLEFKTVSGMNIPMVITPDESTAVKTTYFLDLLVKHRDKLIEMLNQYGGLLLRGFGCQDPECFSQAIAVCDLGNRCSTEDYNIARTVLTNGVYTSTDLPGYISLPLHHEKPRSKVPPDHLYFCCATPADKGGGTLFANAENIWLDIPKNIQDNIGQNGVIYKRYFHNKSFKFHLLKNIFGGKNTLCWQDFFGNDNKNLLEKKLNNLEKHWEWVRKSRDLIIINKLPGVLAHPTNKRLVWFNSADYLNYYSNNIYGELKDLSLYKYLIAQYLIKKDCLPLVCHYGNGQAFSALEVAKIKGIIKQHVCVFNWEQGDFMIVDNYTFMHGKQSHHGKRLLYSCMTVR